MPSARPVKLVDAVGVGQDAVGVRAGRAFAGHRQIRAWRQLAIIIFVNVETHLDVRNACVPRLRVELAVVADVFEHRVADGARAAGLVAEVDGQVVSL